MIDVDAMRDFGGCIQRLIKGQSLSRAEAYLRMSEVLCEKQPDLHQGAFLAALAAKGETEEEIVGVWEAIDRHDTVHVDMEGPLLENCGTGMDAIKTFNVSSAAGIVVAACGVKVARHGARAITSSCGTVDVLEACGVDVDGTAVGVAASIASCGIGLFNGMSAEIHKGGLARILGMIRFGSVLNIAASLASPVRASFGVRGVAALEQVPMTSRIMRAIGYQRGMVVHGTDRVSGRGMDELSVCGPTYIMHFDETDCRSQILAPADVGLREYPVAAIQSLGCVEAEAQRFVSVISGGAQGEACEDFTVLNAAAALMIAGQCEELREGIEYARTVIRSGAAIQKMAQWVRRQNRDPEAGSARLSARLGCFSAIRHVRH
ncbi:MAG TPA: anthranilate phosphoribosyltransferase [Verrucomicrobia bacterium]|nr:anthranilate phosphoribosyltransferase [Verrucomicrobiota bacterium]